MELEYKFILESQDQGREIEKDLRERFGSGAGEKRVIAMDSSYYDSPCHGLSAAGYTLRMRSENGERVCCVKYGHAKDSSGLFRRAEYECAADNIEEGARKLEAKVGGDFAGLCTRGFVTVAHVGFVREAVTLKLDGAVCELALDSGHFGEGERREPFCELELEYKSGDESQFKFFALRLAVLYGLKPQTLSKFARAKRAAEKTE